MGSPPQSLFPTLEMKEGASALGAHLTHQKIRSQHLYSREVDRVMPLAPLSHKDSAY